ncbi:MAG TPA: hypothetical protein VJM11_09925 [Nevskiaceae bacterium]|nr:hypothetical protein [Nevskiaceae bacterium]
MRSHVIAACFLATMALMPQSASAVQYGVAFGGATGEGDFEVDDGSNAKVDFDLTTGEVGFALGLGKSSPLLVYRLNAGIIAGEVEYEPDLFDEDISDDLAGVVINNTLGFKFVNGPTMRVWAGGTAYLSAFTLDGDVADEADATFIGIGPTLGMDFDAGGSMTISLELAWRFLNVDVEEDDELPLDEIKADDIALRLSLLWGS